ncbi:hypothetical protein F1559_000233 [Cyanidiococcus yangmingshanensis]|uniref:Uncharacterized protein n=1 Tax=Cyanidiococcus yangmingshanensis TaxID=2690220 RepID=A0A7J7ILN0_9RHOD|nr:hypothetical protein F1559_000233 [Cyanidiococcus yangmingshanensis]
MRFDPRPWLSQLRPRARSTEFRLALQETERLPELEEASTSALERAVKIAQKLPQHSLQAAALYAHVAALQSWLARDQLRLSARCYRKAWIALGRGSETLQEDALASWNSQQVYAQYLRNAQLYDWPHAVKVAKIPESNDRTSKASAALFGVMLHRLLTRAHHDVSSDCHNADLYAKLTADAQRFLDKLRDSVEGEELVGRSLLALGATLRSQDMLQAALTHLQGSPSSSQAQNEETLFTEVVALCENARVALWRMREPQASTTFSFDDEQCESMLTDALTKAKALDGIGLSLIPLTTLAAFYLHIRKDPVVAEGLYRACLDRVYDANSTMKESTTRTEVRQSRPILSPAGYQALSVNALAEYANLLAHLEWNGRPRTAESRQVAERAHHLIGPDVQTSTLSDMVIPSWRVWYAERSRSLRDMTL